MHRSKWSATRRRRALDGAAKQCIHGGAAKGAERGRSSEGACAAAGKCGLRRPCGLGVQALSVRARPRSAVGELGELGGLRVQREFGNGREKKEKRSKQCLAWFDRGKLKIFELNLKSFEYQSCSSCQNIQLWFQTFSHLRLGLKVKNSNSSLNENPLNLLFFGFFSKFHVVT